MDHKNRNKMDNTRENLRVCTKQENCCNRTKKRGSSSRFMGVSYWKEGDKWESRIALHGKRTRLGIYKEEVEAARAYDYRAVELAGEFARVNFPEEWPAERIAEVHGKASESQPELKKSKKVANRTSRARKKVEAGPDRETKRRAGSTEKRTPCGNEAEGEGG